MRTRILIPLLVIVLVSAACGDDGEPQADGEQTTTTAADTTTTTAADDGDGDDDGSSDDGTDAGTTSTTSEPSDTTTTAAPAGGPTGVLASGTVTTADGLTSNWELSAEPDRLCFTASLAHSDPDEAAGLGSGVDACLSPTGGLDDIDGGLSVDIGSVDGDRRIGYLWGRVDANVGRLTIQHADGSITNVEVLDGPTDVKVFAYVVEIASIPAVVGLDAISGEQIEGSANIRDFLRAGPTYPEVAPTTTPPPPDYPTS